MTNSGRIKMSSAEILDDPLWEYVMHTKLDPYIPAVRKFWEDLYTLDIKGTGVYEIKYEDVDTPPGLMYRTTSTPVRSPIKGIQVFPFVPVAYLQLSRVAGGVSRMITRFCADNKFTIDEFTLIEKSNLPSTYHNGQFIAFIPTNMLENTEFIGKWVYLKTEEMQQLIQGVVSEAVKCKLIRYI